MKGFGVWGRVDFTDNLTLSNMKKLFVVIFLLIVALPSFVQSSERRETIVIPVATLGNISESRKQIIQNTLNQELSKYFRLVPQDKFEEAQEKAFEELDYEECTEDQCIILIQEFLQVENVFSLQLVEEDGDTQLSLTWVGLDEKKVQTDFCEGCKTKELNKKISKLVLTIFNKLEVTEKKGIQPPEKNEQIVNEKEIPVKNDIKINPNNSNIRFDGLIVFDRTKIEGFDN